MSIISYGQSNTEAIYDAINKGDLELAISEIYNLENTLGESIDDNTSLRLQYYKGVVNSELGENKSAFECFNSSCAVAEKIGYIGLEYLDALHHIMRYHYDSQDYCNVIESGMKAVSLPEKLLETYNFSSFIYTTLISSLSYETRFTEIDSLYHQGLKYQKLHFSPSQEEYYNLPVTAIVAYTLMGQHSKAETIFNDLNLEYQSCGRTLDSIENGLASLKEVLNSFNKYTLLDQRKAMAQNIGDRILFADQSTTEGAQLWHRYFDLLRGTLGFFYFDVASSQDEDYWNWFLAQMILKFYVCCDYLPNRESLAYDNVLLKKNFLNYHSGRAHKKPYTWRQVSEMLDSNEVAIEITVFPDEILVLKPNAESPLAIPIDSVTVETLSRHTNNYQDIRSLYTDTGTLAHLWGYIEPYLQGVSNIYISTSNLFNRFNYGAIPLYNGTVSDKYHLVSLLSTADIKQYKETELNDYDSLSSAILYGGIQYNFDCKKIVSESSKYSNIKQANEWSMTRGLEESTRGKFHYLKGSLDEVKSVDEILNLSNFSTTVLTEFEANEESFKTLSGKNVDIIHMATHGFMLAHLFNSDNSATYKEIIGNKYQTILSHSGLALAGANHVWEGNIIPSGVHDGIVTSKEIGELDLRKVKLVVLSACNTGLGDETNLTGLSYGVLHAFKMAGAQKILASLWPIDDNVTCIFMRVFYEHLIKNDCRIALKLTQRRIQDLGYKNPYYWAGFILIE
jgi:hypothetical protein